jgi:hypothetical protein
MPSFRRVMDAIDEAWRERREEIEEQATALASAIGRRTTLPDSFSLDAAGGPDLVALAGELLQGVTEELADRFDGTWGGFGPAPKFPQPTQIDLVLRHHRLAGDDRTLVMATTTLGAMAAGGLYDHLGGGFSRYSVDPSWTVPHFEKMLYDQAGLTRAFLHGWQVTGDPAWLQVVEETIGYVLRDLASPAGGLYSAEDADSEGVEGKFYVWSPEELEDVLGPEAAAEAAAWYGVADGPNFEGKSILRRPVGAPLARPDSIEASRIRLFEARSSRVRPGLDDKVLTEWNAMFCSALAEAAGATGRADWADAAVSVAEFLWAELRRPEDGRLLRSWQEGRARHLAYAADYAWLVDALTRMAELTGEPRWLERATSTATELLRLFRAEPGEGLLFTTGSDAEALVVRPMDLLDGATPSANSVAATAFLRLGALAGDPALTDAGQELLELLVPVAVEHPLALANVVAGCALASGGTTEVVVTGDRPDLVGAVRSRFEPTVVLAWGEPTGSPLWEGRAEGAGYVCRRFVCQTPASTAEQLLARLDAERHADATALAGHRR